MERNRETRAENRSGGGLAGKVGRHFYWRETENGLEVLRGLLNGWAGVQKKSRKP